jgi:hypothetical protein
MDYPHPTDGQQDTDVPGEPPPESVSVTDSACQEKHPSPLFSDRFWGTKLALALGLLAVLGARSESDPPESSIPEVDHSAKPIDLMRGRKVQFWGHRVRSIRGSEFEIDSDVGPIRIQGEAPLPKDAQYVSGVGTVQDTRLVRATQLRVNPGYPIKRGLTYGVSVLTVLGYLWLVRRRFQWRPEEGVLRSRY